MDPILKYISQSPIGHQEALSSLRKMLQETLIPLGFREEMSYGMIGYVIPFSLYKEGYHVDPTLPLPFVALASQKHGIHLYHM